MSFTFTVLGDSITTGQTSTFALGVSQGRSWAAHAAGNGVTLKGGFAKSGFTSYEINANAVRVDPVDVLVNLSGTNDMSEGMDRIRTKKYICSAAWTVHAEQTLICGVPPMTGIENGVIDFNSWLQTWALCEGYDFLDPWVDMRDPITHEWLPGMSTDGRHPNATSIPMLGAAIRAKMITMVDGLNALKN